MSRFITQLQVQEVDDTSHDGRGTWKLLQALVYQSDLLGRTVTVPGGFVTDFASVPRIPVAFMLAGDTAHSAAVVHDWLYTTHEVSRADADAVLREAAQVAGVPAWRARLMWAGVRVGGAGPWEADGAVQPRMVSTLIDALHPEGS